MAGYCCLGWSEDTLLVIWYQILHMKSSLKKGRALFGQSPMLEDGEIWDEDDEFGTATRPQTYAAVETEATNRGQLANLISERAETLASDDEQMLRLAAINSSLVSQRRSRNCEPIDVEIDEDAAGSCEQCKFSIKKGFIVMKSAMKQGLIFRTIKQITQFSFIADLC
ncbi:unnamed protein product [Gongylonema pulchrum]|uniref:Phosphoprotein n=1 Tax=Gongylonema pulchrum TaxID=637853 RepID=A0A183DT79_9BILA|nr:unnamed protein product [Gongylonema pulchrum]